MSGSQSQENYLDQLLKSVNKAKRKTQEEREYEAMIQSFIDKGDEEDDFEYRRSVRERVLEKRSAAKEEEEFIREFEEELLSSEYEGMLESYEEEMGIDRREMPNFENFYKGEGIESDEEFYRGFKDKNATVEPETNEMLNAVDNILETVAANMNGDDGQSLSEEDSLADLALQSDEEPNLAGDGDDLLSLLAGSEEFADIGDMLSNEGGVEEFQGTDVFAAFADSELEKQAIEQDGGPSKQTSKKKGFFAKFLDKLFGPDEEEEEVILHQKNSVDVSALSSENDMILMGFEDSLDGTAGGTKDKKEKKAKKEKKVKEKADKPKKEKKPKAPKPKKEKKPKEIDRTPPLPKGPVVLIWVMAASLLLLIILGTNLISYNSAVSEARTLFDNGQYAKAYEALVGVELKEKELEMYNQLTVLAAPDGQLDAYRVFVKVNDHTSALNALINAAGRCEINAEAAVTLECEGYLNTIKNKVTNELREQYGMTYEEAMEMYKIRKRDDYTIALHEKIEELGLK